MEVRKSDTEPLNFLQDSFEVCGLLPRIDQPVLPFVVRPVNQQAHRSGDGRTHLFSEQFGTMEVAVIEID